MHGKRNIHASQCDLMSYPTLYACIARIATDIGKLPFVLKRKNSNGIWEPIKNPAYDPVLKKPNQYQTASQFRESWIISKLMDGNAYILKRRDSRGIVNGLTVLDPERVIPMVSDSGNVYYQVITDKLNKLPDNYPGENLIIPASEIIHDRSICIHHPLLGMPPLAAAYYPALKNSKILQNSVNFFANNANPWWIAISPSRDEGV